MRRLAIAAAAAALSLAVGIGARAQTAYPSYVFTTIDAVSSYRSQLKITGILQGQAVATEITVSFSETDYAAANVAAQTCERKALLAMNKPGQYKFEVSLSSSGYPACKLTRVNP
jgi:hypothetical protein